MHLVPKLNCLVRIVSHIFRNCFKYALNLEAPLGDDILLTRGDTLARPPTFRHWLRANSLAPAHQCILDTQHSDGHKIYRREDDAQSEDKLSNFDNFLTSHICFKHLGLIFLGEVIEIPTEFLKLSLSSLL